MTHPPTPIIMGDVYRASGYLLGQSQSTLQLFGTLKSLGGVLLTLRAALASTLSPSPWSSLQPPDHATQRS